MTSIAQSHWPASSRQQQAPAGAPQSAGPSSQRSAYMRCLPGLLVDLAPEAVLPLRAPFPMQAPVELKAPLAAAIKGGQGQLEPDPEPEPEEQEEALTRRERAHWALLGLGCTWFMNDALFLQLPFWLTTQPEGLKLGARIALAGSLTPLPAALAVWLQWRFPHQQQQLAIPLMISLSASAGALLAMGLWRLSSWFIYVPMLMAASVGGLTPYVQLPWVLARGFKPAVISPLFLGGSVGSLSLSLVAIAQSPGGARRFSPSVFFLMATLPLAGAVLAYSRIVRGSVGASASEMRGSLQGARGAQEAAANGLPGMTARGWAEWRSWVPEILPLALWMSTISMCTWTVTRSSMGFATTHTVAGHHLCRPECASWCASLVDPSQPKNRTACAAVSMCTVVSSAVMSGGGGGGGGNDDGRGTSSGGEGGWQCSENRGEVWLGWMTALAQWAYTAGIGLTIVLPSFKLWRISTLYARTLLPQL
jgi:hypothetical protein